MPRSKKQTLPLIPVRGLVVFPYMVLHFDVARQKNIYALEEAMVSNQLVFLSAQRDVAEEDPSIDDIYEMGTVSRIKQLLKLPGETIRVLVEGLYRGEISKATKTEPFVMSVVTERRSVESIKSDVETEALTRRLHEVFEEYLNLNTRIAPETMGAVLKVENAGQLADVIAANLTLKIEDKQSILSELDVRVRMERLTHILTRENEVMRLERSIISRVKGQMDKNQRDYFLREQLKAIHKELGEEDPGSEIEEYHNRIMDTILPRDVEKKLLKEVSRLKKMPPGMSEATVVRTYIDWVLDMPWGKFTPENLSLTNAADILERDHYGLSDVKERVLEHLAVRRLTGDMGGPILCLAGPPGVGKTSIARSMAEALGRNYVRVSLGGVRDEADIRGHRKTYIGALPGRIMTGMRQADSMNPLILLDEVDKMGNDFRGDPSSALLEVLDSEQNSAFRDHYLEVPFDLSKCLFVTTANALENIPRPLLDRMEVIRISGYTREEKQNIAERYLVPKQLKKNGLTKRNVRISRTIIETLIDFYTREAGVRNLERELSKLCRKGARLLSDEGLASITISKKRLEAMLGPPRFRVDMARDEDEIGVVTGLAWTAMGGDTLSIEVNVMPGTGKLVLTGSLGDVMKESARAAVSYCRSRTEALEINADFYKDTDIHIHVPEGATPKDGPSAGITMAVALISALSGRAARRDVAMTGEITLRGRVLPIGGLKEKLLAAHRANIKTVIIPQDNRKDLKEIPDNILEKLHVICASNMDTVLSAALARREAKPIAAEQMNYLPALPEQTESHIHFNTASQ